MAASKPVQQLESDIATVRFSGGILPGQESDSETPSESEPEDVSFTNKVEKRRASNSSNEVELQSGDNSEVQVSFSDKVSISPVDASGDNSVMVSSSDSGCPCSPLVESAESRIDRNSVTVESSKEDEILPPEINIKDKVHDEKLAKPRTLELNSDASDTNTTSNGQDEIPTVTSPTRFNPFDKEPDSEDHDLFPQLRGNVSGVRNERIDSFTSDFDPENDTVTEVGIQDDQQNAALGIREDYFSQPEGHFGMMTTSEIQAAIQRCREEVLKAPQESELKKSLVHQLVQLRLKLAEAQEDQVTPAPHLKPAVGHMFALKDGRRSRRYCEHCNTVIWGVLQNWYRCDSCGYCCHEKCLDQVSRGCASLKAKESPEFNLTICPEKSLSSQGYKCAECRTLISYHSSEGEPRLCDYTGSFYCDRCHWNDMMAIPARVLHNWDFEPRKVCRGTKQFLKIMRSKAVLRVQDINPMLFNFVEEVNDVKKLREEILIMKKYFLSCKDALQSKLLLQLQDRQHFVENSDMFSLQDLTDIADDVLLPELAKIHASFAQHIKTDCELCKCKGFHCELCTDHEVLFPFDNIAIVCSQCSTVLHRHCYMRRNQKCPKCIRICSRTD